MPAPADKLDLTLEKLGAWSGIAWVVLAGGAFGLAGFIPILSPGSSPEVVVDFVTDNKYRILSAMVILLIGGYTFVMTWGITFARQVRKYANPSAMVHNTLYAVALNAGVLGMLFGMIGTAMAYRVESLPPSVIQVMYDLIWFCFLLPWPPFMLWQMVGGFALISGTNPQHVFPRWTGYFTLWAGSMEVLSALIAFFYSGPFSYSGAVAFWVPGIVFFAWILVLSIVQVKALSRHGGEPRLWSDQSSPQPELSAV